VGSVSCSLCSSCSLLFVAFLLLFLFLFWVWCDLLTLVVYNMDNGFTHTHRRGYFPHSVLLLHRYTFCDVSQPTFMKLHNVANRTDYYNSVPNGATVQVIRRLRTAVNAATRVVADRRKYEHITPVLLDVLHWLPVLQRIQFNVAFLTFSCVRGGAGPAYFQHVCIATANLSGGACLRSAERGDLAVLRTATYGIRQTQLPRRGSGHPEQSP